MSYIINNSRGNIIAIVPEGTVNTSATSLALVGQAVTDYGTAENENYVFLLENFAKDTAPLLPILGQLWYQANTDTLQSYSSANSWSALASQTYVQAQKISPVFTGTPLAPTATTGTNTTQIATTAFVTSSPQFAGIPTAPTASAGTNTTQIATTAFVTSSPQFTGTPLAPTATAGTNTTQLATTAFVTSSPQFTGIPLAPTAVSGTNTTQIATTAFVTSSPAFAGTPTAPTATVTDDSIQIATTAFVQSQKISPVFTGTPSAPTPVAGNNTDRLATTAFVSQAVTNFNTGLGTMAAQNSNAVGITGGNISGLVNALPVASGGTGASDAPGARTQLGLSGMAIQSNASVNITGGFITNTVITPTTYWTIAQGGTGAGTAETARSNLGLGTAATQNANNVSITGGTITGITALAVAAGGTGGNTQANARTGLGLGTISTQDSDNVSISGGNITGVTLASTDWGTETVPVFNGGTGGNNAAQARTNLGLGGIPAGFTPGTIATQNANNVSITGGTITDITPLAVTFGGTGGNDATSARANLQVAWSGTTITAGSGLTGGGNLTTSRTIAIATDSNGYGTRYVSSSLPSGGTDGDVWYQI